MDTLLPVISSTVLDVGSLKNSQGKSPNGISFLSQLNQQLSTTGKDEAKDTNQKEINTDPTIAEIVSMLLQLQNWLSNQIKSDDAPVQKNGNSLQMNTYSQTSSLTSVKEELRDVIQDLTKIVGFNPTNKSGMNYSSLLDSSNQQGNTDEAFQSSIVDLTTDLQKKQGFSNTNLTANPIIGDSNSSNLVSQIQTTIGQLLGDLIPSIKKTIEIPLKSPNAYQISKLEVLQTDIDKLLNTIRGLNPKTSDTQKHTVASEIKSPVLQNKVWKDEPVKIGNNEPSDSTIEDAKQPSQAVQSNFTEVMRPFIVSNSSIDPLLLKDHSRMPLSDLVGHLEDYMKTVSENKTTNVTKIAIELQPETLGKVAINIQSNQGHITAQFLVDNPAAKHAVEEQLSQLKNTLAAQGIVVDKLEVSNQAVSANNSLPFFQQQRQQQEQRAFNGKTKKNSPYAQIEDELDLIPKVEDRVYSSGINYVV